MRWIRLVFLGTFHIYTIRDVSIPVLPHYPQIPQLSQEMPKCQSSRWPGAWKRQCRTQSGTCKNRYCFVHTRKPTSCTCCCKPAQLHPYWFPSCGHQGNCNVLYNVFMKLIGTVNPSAAVCISHILALRCMHGHSQSSNEAWQPQSGANDLEVKILPREVAWRDDRLNLHASLLVCLDFFWK